MQKYNDNSSTVTSTDNTINVSQPPAWVRRIVLACIVVIVFGILVCTGLLIQVSMLGKPVFELLRYGSFKPELRTWGYSSFVVFLLGQLAWLINAYRYTSINTVKKRLDWVWTLTGATLMFLSFLLLFVSLQPGFERWVHLSLMTFLTSFHPKALAQSISKERRELRKNLEIISYGLQFLGSVGLVFTSYLQIFNNLLQSN